MFLPGTPAAPPAMVAGSTVPPPVGTPSTAVTYATAISPPNHPHMDRPPGWETTSIRLMPDPTGRRWFFAANDDREWWAAERQPPAAAPPIPFALKDHYNLVFTRDPWSAPGCPGSHFRRAWPRFMSAAGFEGRRRGYCFRLGLSGLGYYLDAAQGYLPRPEELRPSNDHWRAVFFQRFGVDWDDMVNRGRILHAADGARALNTDIEGMADIWAGAAAVEGHLASLSKGLRVGRFHIPGDTLGYIFIINGFYPQPLGPPVERFRRNRFHATPVFMGPVQGHTFAIDGRGLGYRQDSYCRDYTWYAYDDPVWLETLDDLRIDEVRERLPLGGAFPSMAPAVQGTRRMEPGFSSLLDMVPKGDTHDRIGYLTTGHDVPHLVGAMPAVPGRVLSVGAQDMDAYFTWRFGISHGTAANLARCLWCCDGSGTVHKRGVIQAGLAYWQAPLLGASLHGNEAPCPGHTWRTFSAAFPPVRGLYGSGKCEDTTGGGTAYKVEFTGPPAEELALAWALCYIIRNVASSAEAVVVDSVLFLEALCGLRPPSLTTAYTRSVLAEALAQLGSIMLVARQAIPFLSEEAWGPRGDGHSKWPADRAACEARLTHHINIGGYMTAEGQVLRCESRTDVDPRAWGAGMCIIRFFQPDLTGSDGMLGRSLGVLIRNLPEARLQHRGQWLWLWPVAPAGHDSFEAKDEIIEAATLEELRRNRPMEVVPTRRNAKNPPVPVHSFFTPLGDPSEAVYTGGQGSAVHRRRLHDTWWQMQVNPLTGRAPRRPEYMAQYLRVRSKADRHPVVSPFTRATLVEQDTVRHGPSPVAVPPLRAAGQTEDTQPTRRTIQWEATYDGTSGRYYYFNPTSGALRWEAPTDQCYLVRY